MPEANTQWKMLKRENWPEWMKQLPVPRFEPEEPEPTALLNEDELEAILQKFEPAVADRVRKDIQFLDYELLRLFRQRDHEAKKQQNRYRTYQIAYLLLAAGATLIGSLQALSLAGRPALMALCAFGETAIALIAVYLATISGREPPQQIWMENRRRAEQLRREYFRFLANLPPYDTLQSVQRSVLLSKRAAEINRGHVPPEPDKEKTNGAG